ncbi:hypothetical protein AGLY_004427 [Aphis glycines]|uniref:Uncharacterized protein n=1 Tax=Aphis glycines TaxID=307491 RepID=A0A6G0TY15_APHGL|nr:hypothetical protein AGLY_004427 [Aphis glycines]
MNQVNMSIMLCFYLYYRFFCYKIIEIDNILNIHKKRLMNRLKIKKFLLAFFTIYNKASGCLSIIFRSIHKFQPANIGDSMRVSLPDVHIGWADPRNIISAVLPIEDGQYYKLGNKYGTLPHSLVIANYVKTRKFVVEDQFYIIILKLPKMNLAYKFQFMSLDASIGTIAVLRSWCKVLLLTN